VYRGRKAADKVEGAVSLSPTSPVALRKVLKFGLLFLSVQLLAILGHRLIGNGIPDRKRAWRIRQ